MGQSIRPGATFRRYGVRHGVLVFAAFALLFAGAAAKEVHETAVFYASLARDIADSGDAVGLYQGDGAYLLKPPLLLWLTALAIKALGPTSLAATLFSRLFGVAVVLLTHAVARRLYGRTTAWFASLVLLTNSTFHQYTATMRMDSLLTTGILLSILGYLAGRRPWASAAFFGGIAIAVLAKLPPQGLTALFLVPLYAVVARTPVPLSLRWLAWSWLLLIPLVWYGYLWALHGDRLVTELVADWARGTPESLAAHLRSMLKEYVRIPLQQYWPWLPFMLAGLWIEARHSIAARISPRRRARALLLVTWSLGTVILASIKPYPGVHYLYPVLPALAMLAGRSLAACARGHVPAWTVPATGGIALAVVYLVSVAKLYPPDARPLIAAVTHRVEARPEPGAPVPVIGTRVPDPDSPRRENSEVDWVRYYLGRPVRILPWQELAAAQLDGLAFVLVSRSRSVDIDRVLSRFKLHVETGGRTLLLAIPSR